MAFHGPVHVSHVTACLFSRDAGMLCKHTDRDCHRHRIASLWKSRYEGYGPRIGLSNKRGTEAATSKSLPPGPRHRTLKSKMFPFFQRSRGDPWQKVGLASAFPDLSLDKDCSRITPSCKAFRIPKANGSSSADGPEEASLDTPGDMKDQVLVFQYKGKFHAVDHVSETRHVVIKAIFYLHVPHTNMVRLSHVPIRPSRFHKRVFSTLRISASL